jgi:hypothetical protein
MALADIVACLMLTGLLKSSFLLPQAAKFFWIFGEKADGVRFFTKYPEKTSEQPQAARSLA